MKAKERDRRRGRGRRRSRGETRARIVEAATALTEKHGFERTSMGEIAREAGIGTSTLYHHFPDKRTLLLELIQSWSEQIASGGQVGGRLEVWLRADPRAFLAGLLREQSEQHDRTTFAVDLYLLAHQDEELRVCFQNVRLAGAARLATIIELGQQQGLLRKRPDPATAALIVIQAIELLSVNRHMLRRPEEEIERMLDELTDMLCRYLVEGD